MDIFKNVQNEKPEIFFENSKLFYPCDENALKILKNIQKCDCIF
jgi:hypothetical protein